MLGHLVLLEEKPWAAFGRKEKTLTAHQLGRLLKRYKIKSGTVRLSSGTLKGFYKTDFEDAWMRYLPKSKRHNDTSLQNKDLRGFQSVTTTLGVTDGICSKSLINKDCDGVTEGILVSGGQEVEMADLEDEI